MPVSEHFHVIAAQDYGTAREWWTIRTNPYDHGEAEQSARQLLAWEPDRHAYRDEPDDQAETGDDQPAPAWSAVWITPCAQPCTWAAVPPNHAWTLPPPGDPWWAADTITPRPPARTANVVLSTLQPATESDLRRLDPPGPARQLLTLTDADRAQLKLTDRDRALLALSDDERRMLGLADPDPIEPSDG
jgi:hypothetical protein